MKRTAAHPGTGDESLPDDRYTRTLDPWISLATAAAVTTRIGLSTAVALPVESDPITLAKAIATLDHLSGGRVTIGAGFGWNTDELEDHHVPADRRRTVLREYVEAMRALWTQEEASYDGEFVSFGPSWAYPKPVQAHIPLIIGAGGGPKTFAWIAANADGWMTTPTQTDISGQIEALKTAWTEAGRDGHPGHPGPDRLPARPRRPDGLGRGRRLRADLGRPGQVRGRGAGLPRQAGRPAGRSPAPDVGLDAVEDPLEAERELAAGVGAGLVGLARRLADPAGERVVAVRRELAQRAGVGLPPLQVGRRPTPSRRRRTACSERATLAAKPTTSVTVWSISTSSSPTPSTAESCHS